MLRLDGVSRYFSDHKVLDEVTFSVQPGRLTGFVGGNGAGKTTTMRIILGVLAPHGGGVSFRGSPLSEEQRRSFGYMPEERGLYPKMKAAEQIAYLARLHGFERRDADRRARDLLGRLGLDQRADDALETLSLGNQQRVQIAAALVHEPEVLILDEPFSGLDPLAVEVVLGVLGEYADRGVPVLFSSHQLDLVERLCDELVIIAGGRVRAAGTREELRDEWGVRAHELVSSTDLGWVRDVPGVHGVEFDGGNARFEGSEDVAQQVLAEAMRRGSVIRFGPVRASLGEIFKDVVTDETDARDRQEVTA